MKTILRTLLLGVALGSVCFLQAQRKAEGIAVVDLHQVLNSYHKVKAAKVRMTESQKTANEEIALFREDLRKILAGLKETQQKLRNPNLDGDALRKKYQEQLQKARAKEEDLRGYEKRVRATLLQRQKNLFEEHMADVRASIKKVAVARGLVIVINSSSTQGVVFYVDPAKPELDVTKAVIAVMNVSTPKK